MRRQLWNTLPAHFNAKTLTSTKSSTSSAQEADSGPNIAASGGCHTHLTSAMHYCNAFTRLLEPPRLGSWPTLALPQRAPCFFITFGRGKLCARFLSPPLSRAML